VAAGAWGLSIAGTAAVIAWPEPRPLIPSARAVLSQLHDSDFRDRSLRQSDSRPFCGAAEEQALKLPQEP